MNHFIRANCQTRVEVYWDVTIRHLTGVNFRWPVQKMRLHLRDALFTDAQEYARRVPQAPQGHYRGWTAPGNRAA